MIITIIIIIIILWLLLRRMFHLFTQRTAVADGDAISLAGIWLWTKILDKFKPDDGAKWKGKGSPFFEGFKSCKQFFAEKRGLRSCKVINI